MLYYCEVLPSRTKKIKEFIGKPLDTSKPQWHPGKNGRILLWAEQGIGELCVIETNAEGCVGEQFCIDVAVIPTNISEEEQGNISVFPNPASTSFTIAADERLLNLPYRLFDSQGRLVLEGMIRANNTLVQTEALSSGSYTLSISNGDQVVTETIVLQ